ncbi:MAG: shikimate kinase [Clostridia bacterium]
MIFERNNNFERLILIGMPCSGKSSIGKYLAQHYRLEFYDMDEEIVKAANLSIQEIFEKKGEAAFRELETQVTISLSEKQNALIATGGGIVTRENNMRYFQKKGSLIVFIHRDFCKLATTPKRIMDKRPMLQKTSFDKLLKLYKTRLPLYRKYCDIEIHNDSNKDDAVREITRAIDNYPVPGDHETNE